MLPEFSTIMLLDCGQGNKTMILDQHVQAELATAAEYKSEQMSGTLP
jgi:hypothetical protein